ncbi:hypothetical protein [Novipirellula artificiosorum]|uniref:Uncharacterized protein n=1 Tax=Novipirellula artificiosorum TaxID=2528016 RepID=A0A5C6DMT5_9BACT|nr:hypothetical protein [Novipirellula artificiosorum]TWU37167.1 hypothetical protein Poly41_32940 [Novipirellula artificiosorum]
MNPFLLSFVATYHRRFAVGICCFAAIISSAGSLHAETETVATPANSDRSATELLPSSIVGFAQVSNLGQVMSTVIDHPLHHRIKSLPAYEAFLESEPRRQLRVAIDAFEGSMGQPWQQALATLSDGGISVALDSKGGGVALLVKSSSRDSLERLRGFLLAISSMKQGGTTPQQGEYRGFTAYQFNKKLKMALVDNWCLITNSSELGQSIIDQYLDGGGESLQSKESFRQSVESMDSQQRDTAAVWGCFDVEALRNAGVAEGFFNEKVDNFGGELVLGGMIANLRHTPFVTGTVHLEQPGLRLQLATPHDRDWEPPREYYFGEASSASAPPLLNLENRLFAVSSHRDLSQMWLRAGDLLSDRVVDQLAKADTQLTTLFSGRDFGEDILGALESEIQIIGVSQDFSDHRPRPAIQLPAFAIQFRMKTPAETQPEIRRIFQSFVGFANVTGAMNGQPPLDLGLETSGSAQMVTATYVPERDERDSVTAPIQFNFSPTIAFASERVIFSSSTALARQMVQSAGTSEVANDRDANTELLVDVNSLHQVLEANRPQLVAGNMLEKGNSENAAQQEIGLLLEMVGLMKQLSLELNVAETQMQLNAAITVDSDRPQSGANE